MARPKLGHFLLLVVYPVVIAGMLGSLGLVVWTHWLVNVVYPYHPSIVSPLPNHRKVESWSVPAPIEAENLWFPTEATTVFKGVEKPLIRAAAYLVVDLDTSRILLAHNYHQRKPIASLVKIMTALVAMEKSDPDELLTVSERAASVGEDSMGLIAGEKLSLKELLAGLILVSGNDAAEVIAEDTADRRELFVAWMNSKAYELGLTDTRFANPSGLMEKQNQEGGYLAEEYSTAYDLAVIARALLENGLLREIAALPELEIPATSNHQAYYLYSQTNLITTDPRVKGLKMGYTPAAGLSGVTYAESDGHRVVGVVLNTPTRRDDLKALINYAFWVIKS